MTKCSNCTEPAEYVYASIGAETQYFCTKDIPWTLQPRFLAGALEKVDSAPVAEAVAEEPVEAVAEEAVAETVAVEETPEAVAEEAVAETPKKKSTKAVATDTPEA